MFLQLNSQEPPSIELPISGFKTGKQAAHYLSCTGYLQSFLLFYCQGFSFFLFLVEECKSNQFSLFCIQNYFSFFDVLFLCFLWVYLKGSRLEYQVQRTENVVYNRSKQCNIIFVLNNDSTVRLDRSLAPAWKLALACPASQACFKDFIGSYVDLVMSDNDNTFLNLEIIYSRIIKFLNINFSVNFFR